MSSAPLPPTLEYRLVALGNRVRRLRVVRGVCWVIIAALFTGCGIVLLDVMFRPAMWTRCAFQVGWIGLLGSLVWRFIIQPWQTEVPLTELAKRIEGEFTELGERLLTVVSLLDADSSSGSPQLVASLARETELSSRGMDFARAAPANPVIRIAVGVGVLVVVTAVVAAALPGSGEELRRVALPWHRPTGVVPFRILVTSGDPVVRRGGPVTLSAYLEPAHSGVDLPESAVLVFRPGPDCPSTKLPMTGDRSAAFHVTRPNVMTGFEYWVEAGRGVSDRHIVQVADAVNLTDQSSVEIVPPLYAGRLPATSITGLSELSGLQHSVATLRFQFDRPAGLVTLEWRTENQGSASGMLVPVELTSDQTGATATVPLKENGTLRLSLATEPGSLAIRTETLLPVCVAIDTPPRFEQLSGVTILPRTLRPGERLHVALVAVDDIGVGSAEIEYSTSSDPGKTARIPIPLTGAGTSRAEGRATLDLMGHLSDGETIRFRVCVADTRNVVEPRLGPQEAVYPPNGWAELKVSSSAPPLDEQDILVQHEAVRQVAVTARKEIDQALHDARAIGAETVGRSPLPIDHAVRLQATRDRIRTASELLHEAARDAALTPDLRPLATSLRDIADLPIRAAADSLRSAATDNPRDREAAIIITDSRLINTIGRINELIVQNDRLAQDRLAHRRLDALAADQRALAARVTTEAAMPPGDILRSQEAMLTRLARILAESPALERGADSATRQEARRLAADAHALAALLRELNAAIAGLSADLRRSLLDELTRSHTGVVDRAAGLFARIDTAARIGRIALPPADTLRRATDLLASERTVDALTELEKLTQSLERTAGEFDRWAAERQDPKVAARQYALWQDDLRTRFVAAPFDRLPAPVQKVFRTEQRAILQAALRLRLPSDPEVTALRDAGLTHLRLAADRVDADGTGAEQAMTHAATALTRLADKTLSIADRLARTRRELDAVRVEQDAIITTAEFVLLGEKQVPDAGVQLALARKLKGVMEQETKLADRLAGLDLPGLESRHTRVVFTLRSVVADLTAGRPFDSLASLAAAKRELDRLRQAVGGQRPADEIAATLAHLQQDINTTLMKLGTAPTAKALEPLLATQKDLAFEIVRLSSPEAPSLLHDAQYAVRLAEGGFRDGSKPEELRRRVGAAADALTRVADRLNGRETDRDRLKRLSDNRLRAARLTPAPIATPPEPDASGEERRRLARESEELSHTRVGGAGQPIKKRVLDLYARLQTRSEPDRILGEQKQLADALLELAKTIPDEVPPAGPGAGVATPEPADAYLPSDLLATELRGLAREVRDGRERLGGLASEVIARTRPSRTNPLAGLEERQRSLGGAIVTLSDTLFASQDAASSEAGRAAGSARVAADRMRVGQMRGAREAGEATARRLHALATSAGNRPWGKVATILATRQEGILTALAELNADSSAVAAQQNATQELLTRKATELARMLDQAVEKTAPDDPVRKVLVDAARQVHESERALVAATKKTVEGAMSDAAQLRRGAEEAFQRAAKIVEGVVGVDASLDIDLPAIESGTAVRQAAAAMRQATVALRSDGDRDPAVVVTAMREAADALHRAAIAVWARPNSTPSGGSLDVSR